MALYGFDLPWEDLLTSDRECRLQEYHYGPMVVHAAIFPIKINLGDFRMATVDLGIADRINGKPVNENNVEFAMLGIGPRGASAFMRPLRLPDDTRVTQFSIDFVNNFVHFGKFEDEASALTSSLTSPTTWLEVTANQDMWITTASSTDVGRAAFVTRHKDVIMSRDRVQAYLDRWPPGTTKWEPGHRPYVLCNTDKSKMPQLNIELRGKGSSLGVNVGVAGANLIDSKNVNGWCRSLVVEMMDEDLERADIDGYDTVLGYVEKRSASVALMSRLTLWWLTDGA